MSATISRLTLGTAQFGQAYGVANQSGAPATAEIHAMLEAAAEGGITCLDTAYAYGESEAVLGRALEETGLRDHFFIVTKSSHLISPEMGGAEARKAVRVSIEESLRRLRCERLPLVLLHRDSNVAHFEALLACQEAGLIERCGVSLTGAASGENFASLPDLAAIQAPVNVLDRRFDAIIATLHQRRVNVFTRSCYLQGLLLMRDEHTPEHLQLVKPARDFFRDLAQDCSMPLPDLLLRAVLDRPDISSVVVGMENLSQLKENLRIFQAPPLARKLLERIWSYTPLLPPWLIDPPQWPAHRQDKHR